jgi:hypothetical protein
MFLALSGAAYGQQDPNAIFICPMDPDVRSHDPGTCPRCGMKMAAGLPEPVEYHLDMTVTPGRLQVGRAVNLTFGVTDPWKHRPVTRFQVVHEKLFHMFVVSEDLDFFVHGHPVFGVDGQFHFDGMVLPKAGMYRLLADFYPVASTPQLIAKTLVVAGEGPGVARLSEARASAAMEFMTVPERPVAGMRTQLHCKLTPGEGLQRYLGAWAHMLIASDDLIDMIHLHPFIADGGAEIQFVATLPRAEHAYRAWVQYQRDGVVHTERFDLRAHSLR